MKESSLTKTVFLGKEISGIFTIPSGIITTDVKVLEKIANEIPEVGVLTTKSIGLKPRSGNREPILTQYMPGCFLNAVGLSNPGAHEFARQLQTIKIPKSKFLLVSIFGKDIEEFVQVAKILASFADGLELNLSCPHAKEYGLSIGQDIDLVGKIVLAVKQAVNIPIIPKLSSMVPNIAKFAKVAVDNNAAAICAINTVPGYCTQNNIPILTNGVGGMSGKAIFPIGLRCVKEIREAVNVPIIGCGGISSVDDIRSYQQAGADIIGIGSALAELRMIELKDVFSNLSRAIESDSAYSIPQDNVDMQFKTCSLRKNIKLTNDFSLLVFDDDSFFNYPSQFIFVWIPGFGEKPFSVLDNRPFTLAVQAKGCLTKKLVELKKGDKIYYRSRYGVAIGDSLFEKTILVSGGCGFAALYRMASSCRSGDVEMFIGAKNKDYLFYVDEAKKHGNVYIATDDGSAGYYGFITTLLKEKLSRIVLESKEKGLIFYNCGPEAMVRKAVNIEKQYVSLDKIYSAIDYETKCGVGLCGSCATPKGLRSCVDGPFISANNI